MYDAISSCTIILVRNVWLGRPPPRLLLLLHLEQLLVAARLVQELRLVGRRDPADVERIPGEVAGLGPGTRGHAQLGQLLHMGIEQLGLLNAQQVGVHQPLLLALHLLQVHLELEAARLVEAGGAHLVEHAAHAGDGEDEPGQAG